MALVTAEELMNELNVDTDTNELVTIGVLIDSAKAMIKSSIQLGATDEQILTVNEFLYNRLIKTIVASLYYDREMTNGYSKGTMIMLTNLRSEVLGAYNA